MTAPRTIFTMNVRAVIMIVLGGALVLGLHDGFRHVLPDSPPLVVGAVTLFVALPLVLLLARRVIHRGVHATVVAVSDGLLSLNEHDYSHRLAVGRKDEIGVLVHRFNELA